jgi:hypothetical protein
VTPRPPNHFRPLVRLAATLALAGVVAGACRTAEDLDGLAVVSFGPVSVTDSAGRLVGSAGPPDGDALRGVAGAGGRIVVQTVNHALFVADVPVGDSPDWRPLPLELAEDRAPTGLDMSPDGTTVAVVLGGPETPDLSIVLVDVATGVAATHEVGLAANGPPTWLGNGLIALEVIRADQHSGIATFDVATRKLAVTDAQGFGLTATSDGDRLALIDPEAGLVATAGVADWLRGGPIEPTGLALPAGATALEVALDADGTRLAVAFLDENGAGTNVALYRQDGGAWVEAARASLAGDAAVGLAWLD